MIVLFSYIAVQRKYFVGLSKLGEKLTALMIKVGLKPLRATKDPCSYKC